MEDSDRGNQVIFFFFCVALYNSVPFSFRILFPVLCFFTYWKQPEYLNILILSIRFCRRLSVSSLLA